MGCDIISQAEDTVYHGHAASGTLQNMSVFYKLAVILSFGEKKYCESANKIIKKIAVMIIALTLAASSVALDPKNIASAAAWGTPYEKADTIISGETYVFFANISNNLSQSDPADRRCHQHQWYKQNL